MMTLDRWRSLLDAPQTITFPRLALQLWDEDPPLAEGPGELRMPDLGRIEFCFRGIPNDIGAFFEAKRRFEDDPAPWFSRMRLIGTDAEGIDWVLGRIWPDVDLEDREWIFSGKLDSVHPIDGNAPRSLVDSTELIFVIPRGSPMDIYLHRFVRNPEREAEPVNERRLSLLGSDISFAYDFDQRRLTVVATHSLELPPTYTENWIGEPLRILFGELVGARLVARNRPDGGGFAYACTVSTLPSKAGWAALWREGAGGADAFWNLYSGLLTLIARSRDASGKRSIEAHKITRLYEEVIQAAAGSRWVWALTFASGIEALVNLLEPRGQPRSESEAEAAEILAAKIGDLDGDARLKSVAQSAVRRAAKVSSVDNMRRLTGEGVVTGTQLDAWTKLRNRVAHGSLVSVYNNEEEDGQLLALAGMFHALTGELIRRQALAAVSQ